MDVENVFCLIFLCCLVELTISSSNYVAITPKIVLSKNVKTDTGLPETNISIIYEHNNEYVILDLNLNGDLLPKEHFVTYQNLNSEKTIKTFTKTDVDLCHYQGKIRDNSQSFVALSTCDGIRGVMFDGRETYYIENEKNGPQQTHFLIRHFDVDHNHKTGNEEDFSTKLISNYDRTLRIKRSSHENRIHAPSNSNEYSNYVELVLVLDNSMYKKLDKSMKKAHQYSKDLVNIMNSFYKPLNIFIALKGVVIWNKKDEIDMSSNASEVLDSFLKYRENRLLKDHPNDNAQLITNVKFEGTTVGLAPVGEMCSKTNSGGVSFDHHKLIQIVAATVTHEMGHNFGMNHDDENCKCNDPNGCIMHKTSSHAGHNIWSSCSWDQLQEMLKKENGNCLKNKPTKLFDSPTCGNGFLEPGEECDCGLPEYCDSSCCNPLTCMLTANSTCATGSCCDLTTCKPHSAGKTCRRAFGECDLPEFCNGNNEFCPDDVYKHNSVECGYGRAYCFEGQCRSHDSQCQKLWGKNSRSYDVCHRKLNRNGEYNGNCGIDKFGKYKACLEQDLMCGTLQCSSDTGEIVLKINVKKMVRTSFNQYVCMAAEFNPIEEGLVPNGAKCGVDKVCSNQKCISVADLKGKCSGCNGHGTCNSKGNCHCEDGWAPPFCNEPGDGGSIDSQDEIDGSSFKLFMTIVYIFLNSLVVCCLLFAAFKVSVHFTSIGVKKNKKLFKHEVLPLTSSESFDTKKLQPVSYQKNEIKVEIPLSKPLLNPIKTVKNIRPNPNVEIKMPSRPLRPPPPPPSNAKNNIKDKIEKFNKLQLQPKPGFTLKK